MILYRKLIKALMQVPTELLTHPQAVQIVQELICYEMKGTEINPQDSTMSEDK